MKPSQLLILLRLLIISAITLPAMLLLSFTADKRFTDIWQQLGITEKDGIYNIKESMIGGYLNYAGVRNLKNIATGDRAAVARDLISYTRLYVSGSEFKKEYERLRTQSKPAVPQKAKTEQELRQERLASVNKSIADLEKTMTTANADMKKMLNGSLDMLKEQVKMYQDPKNEMVKLMVQGEQNNYDYRMKQYAEDTKKWEQTYPADMNLFIKQRLQKMLDLTKDVDYSAALTERNGKKRFVNPAYEHKPTYWKMAFRAGKETTETARSMVQQWLKELN